MWLAPGHGKPHSGDQEFSKALKGNAVMFAAYRRGAVTAMLLAFALGCLLVPVPASAEGSWLDEPLGDNSWNQPLMDIPLAPATAQVILNPACPGAVNRPAESDADAAIQGAGWTVYGSYTGGWGVVIVKGLATYDGMCRPMAYQEFVFVDGTFAGTLSPTPMDSRTDGAGDLTGLQNGDMLTARFERYAPSDPLCCPSSTQAVRYRIDRSGAGPVVVPQAIS